MATVRAGCKYLGASIEIEARCRWWHRFPCPSRRASEMGSFSQRNWAVGVLLPLHRSVGGLRHAQTPLRRPEVMDEHTPQTRKASSCKFSLVQPIDSPDAYSSAYSYYSFLFFCIGPLYICVLVDEWPIFALHRSAELPIWSAGGWMPLGATPQAAAGHTHFHFPRNTRSLLGKIARAIQTCCSERHGGS